ncbi:DNA translocase FtsK [Xanthobacter oligotrophicus]|uniref:DNA translocase FtsK n=1 Tax=Xanthobacter oligotrophicus TaxID=2607286 RepID=UPI001E2E1722|nr:DNA translocase FtsK [Xanthobacter oligotrophicus]MCG5236004.1 DNA translocase FtsK [Xanthobacter oligotrophicus]
MSSFNRPPRSFGYPAYDAEADYAPPADYAAGRSVTPSLGAFAPEYRAPVEVPPAPLTHSWIDLELIPSWLRPFTLDANTRFTRTPDHFLRPREAEALHEPLVLPGIEDHVLALSEAQTAPVPEISSRSWRFVHDPADDAAVVPEVAVIAAIDPPADVVAEATAEAADEVAALAVEPVEAEGLVDDGLALSLDAAEAWSADAPVAFEQEHAAQAAFAVQEALAVQEAVEAQIAFMDDLSDASVEGAEPEVAVPEPDEDLPPHFEALSRLLVLGRAAVPPAHADEQDLAPSDREDQAQPLDAVSIEDAAISDAPVEGETDADSDAEGERVEDEMIDATDLIAEAEAGEPEAEDEEADEEVASDAEDDELLLASDADAYEDEEAGASEGDEDAYEDDAEAEDEDEDQEEDEDLLLADDAEAADAADAGDDGEPLAVSSALSGLPILTEPGPSLWRPYQQSITAHFLGAVAPLGFAPAALAAPVPASSAEELSPATLPAPVLAAPAIDADGEVTDDTNLYDLPPLDLLREPPVVEPDYEMSEEFLDQSSTMLQQVLRDFGVRGEIIDANPGPVVTLYEFEPAPGVKSSRVIGLSADIARSMSAVSARVAVVEGRNVIGIELPNRRRETVWLRELLSSHEFVETHPKLGLCLGKTIGGVPVIADLARMPHLLVAGTTGSGKSVAINTMILSLLYRHTPDACRLIMIDPKMLELSVYEGIPHLLTPVVTDPKKAIIALKWAVKEMEERYKKMSRLAVRNIDGFNARVKEAAEKGEVITRSVQVGFDKETGESLFEEQDMDLTPLPYIVVIVDEMADLMMVAGKEIEGAIQRLAQMARAAGIHLVMATQRPSVDVITGTIKANFPTRISFQVTSKIDSRTILGEMGAETLLGQGDMLFMAGGGRITRVHGPFVSDGEVEKVVAFLKAQGGPDYLDAVILDEDAEVDDEDDAVFDRSSLGEAGGDLYDQAVAIVMRDRKASTSYIQRRLQVGYNKAASLMERMETEGIVGPANHAGKREILSFSRPG